jgi:ubiquinone/menaquinone biosynthesis C-methylase UbiE
MVATPWSPKPVEQTTGQLYGSIWNLYSDEAFDKFSDDHWNKFRNAGLPEDFLKGKICLDAGCGSGRATRSMLKDGAGEVHAIDIGDDCVANTRRRNARWHDRLKVQQGSVLDLPYPANTFDFVHCDGVLHHTTDPFRGFLELVRVAKPGAPVMFGLYGAGGLLNVCIYSARPFRHIVPRSLANLALRLVTRDPVKMYVFLDPFYVPIRKLYRQRDVQAWTQRAGLDGLTRLKHKYNFKGIDRVLKDYNSFGPWFRGEGYLTYMAFKKAGHGCAAQPALVGRDSADATGQVTTPTKTQLTPRRAG